MTFVLNPQVIQWPHQFEGSKETTYPDRKRSIFATHSTTAVGTTWLGGAPILLFLFEDFWIEFLNKWDAQISSQ